ncbi:MAG: glycosyltransferase family 39 protein [Planctomycetota bacterium]|nr:glycosyltransferase family 39 protein [Planctomycetota bacterium]
MGTRQAVVLVALVLAAVVGLQTRWFQSRKSATFDETFYLSCALQSVRDGGLDRELVRKGTAPLPIVISWLAPALGNGGQPRPDRWQSQVGDATYVQFARSLHALLIGVATVWLVFGWLVRRRGLWAATCGGGVLAFSPTMLAHAAIAGADLCFVLLTLVALLAFCGILQNPSTGRVMLAGVACGVAFSAKYSGIFLFPLGGLLLGLAHWSAGRLAGNRLPLTGRRVGRIVVDWGVLLLAGAVTSWMLHGFDVVTLNGIDGIDGPHVPNWLSRFEAWKIPAPLAGVLCQYLHNRAGHRAFLLGQVSLTGWWYYFPCAVFFKSTPSELALGLLVAGGGLQATWRRLAGWRGRATVASVLRSCPDWTLCVWWLTLLIYLALIGTSRIQIGHRYLLLLYPLVVLLAVDGAALWGRRRALRYRCLLAGLLVMQVWSGVSNAPHYLAYFSPLVGGPAMGRQLLGDSNLDWGQDLPELRSAIARRGYERVAIAYFGTAEPADYGIRAEEVTRLSVTQLLEYDGLAVSANHLSGLYPLTGPLRALTGLNPTARAGYSILLYDLRDPRLRNRLEALR